MHRNTLLLVSILAVVAALLVGIRIGQRLIPAGSQQTSPAPTASPTPPPPTMLNYTNPACGISFVYPDSLTRLDSTGSAMFVNQTNASDSVALVCQKNMPRPKVASISAETVTIASLSAWLYHDVTASNNQPIDKLIFTNPKIGLDVLIEGFGPVFQNIVKSIKLLP